jgi:antitoxin component of MazEF toxin-antitoxin module
MDLVIEPIVSKNTQLDELLAEITPDNIYAEEGFGDLVGREIL